MIEKFGLTNNLDEYRDVIWDGRDNPELFMNGGSIERYTFDTIHITTSYSNDDFPNVCMDVYIPPNANSNTPIVTFFPGGGNSADYYSGTHDGGYESIVDYLHENGSDCIVVMPTTYEGLDAMAQYTPDMIAMISEKYGISSQSIMWSGHSMGTAGALYGVANYINQNSDVEPQICFLIDNYAHEFGGTNKKNNEIAIFNSTVDAFQKNGTIVVDFTVWEDQDDNPRLIYMYAEAGVNVLKVEVPRDYPLLLSDNKGNIHDGWGGFGFGHYATRQAFFEAQFYEFYAGFGPLPEGLIYKYYDVEVGDFVEIDRSLIDTPEKLHAFYGNEIGSVLDVKINYLKSLEDVSLAVTSDSGVLGNCINGVIGKIRTSNFVQSGISFNGGFGGSTTSVPTQIPSVVSSFFDSNATFLMGLASDMSAISQIGASFEEINKHLALLAGDLNHSVIPEDTEEVPEGIIPDEIPEEKPFELEEAPSDGKMPDNKDPEAIVPEDSLDETEEVPEETMPNEAPEEEPTPENEPENVVPEENAPENSKSDEDFATGEGGILEDGEEGDYVTEEGDTVGEKEVDGEIPSDGNQENEGNGDDKALESTPEPENSGNDNKPNADTIPAPNQTPNQTPGYSPPSDPTPSSTPNPNPAPSPSQPPQNNHGLGSPSVGGDVNSINPLEQFPEYSEVYSNDNMIVYNFNDEYKIVIHTDGDKIVGIEHYYDFGNGINADNSLGVLMNQYSSYDNFENIVQNDRYVKVIFESDMYENMTINDVREKYSNLNEVIR